MLNVIYWLFFVFYSLKFLLFQLIGFSQEVYTQNNISVLVFLRYGHAFKTQCAVSVTLTSELLRSNCFDELTMTPYVVNGSIFKFIYLIEISGIAPKL